MGKIKTLTILLSLTILLNSINVTAFQENIKECQIDLILSKASLDEIDGVRILTVKGSYYEMGFQQGHLLKYECRKNIRALIYKNEQFGFTYSQLLSFWNESKNYIPQKYVDELHGIADGAEVSFYDVAAIQVCFNFIILMDCFGFVAWDDATKSKKLIQVRSTDLPFDFQDPVTGNFAHENQFLLVRKPDEGYASVAPCIAGFTNLAAGINEKMVGIAAHLSGSKDQSHMGPPLRIRTQMAIDESLNADEAIDIILCNKTLGFCLLVSDAKTNNGYAIEISANHSYVGTWNNSVESNYPFWSIKNVVRRTNFFISPEMAQYQRNRYNPGGLIGILKAFFAALKEFFTPGNDPYYNPNLIYPIWRNYKIISRQIDKKWGNLDLQNALQILRETYNGKNDVLLKIMGKFGKNHGFLVSWNQWAVCPETGDLFVSFADRNNYASKNPIHQFNIYELLAL